MKNFTLTTLFLSLITLTSWGQCNLDTSFVSSVNPSNNLNYSFSVYDSSNTCSFFWDFGDNGISYDAMPTHTYNQAGTYTVCLTMGACGSTCYDTICQTITVTNTNPCNVDASFNASMSSTDSLAYTFNLLDSTQGCNIYWDFGDGSSATNDYASHIYNQSGTYTICATIWSCPNNCADTVCQTITIGNTSNPCNISANFNYNTSLITVPLSYDFSPVDSNFCSTFWDFGDGNSSTSFQPTHSYTAPGTYLVCLTVGSCNFQCYDTICQTITVTNTNPCNVDASFNSTMSSSDSLTYTFNLLDSTQGCSIFWDFGDGSSSNFDFASHTYSQPGTYTVCASIWSCPNNCADTVCQTITVGDSTTAPCNVTANYHWYQLYDSLNGSWVNTVYVVNFSTLGSNVNYFWDFGDNATSNLMFPSHVYSNVGTYTICLTVTDNQGCTSTYCDSIYVQTKASGFTLHVISQDAVGIEEENNIEFGKIYPNPTTDNSFISLKTNKNSEVTISIIDLSGKILSQELSNLSSGENTLQLETNNLTSGMYFVSIKDEKGTSTNFRLIKK